ncbi:MAG TPA: hypothetical protein DEF34_10125 [Desulfotomaculum sp.]|nr:hypothetical protein [Desulfotomaculum sp.]
MPVVISSDEKWDAFLGRVSSEEQAERGNIQTQIEFAKKFFDLHGIDKYKIYLDDGVSGTIPLEDRPGAAEMLADVAAGKIKNLHVYRLDRLARSTKIVLDTYDYLEKHQVPLISMTESFDTGTSTGKFFMTMLASIAALERDTILERTQLGKERGARAGKWVAGAPPFGYRIGEDGHLVVHDPEANTVREIIRLYLSGMATIPIAEYLNARGILTPAKSKRTKNQSTGKWHAGHVSIILRNTAYIGHYEYLRRSKKKKETITVPTPVIIAQDDFDRVQKMLVKNSDAARGRKGRTYLLRGLIFCGHCGGAYVGSSGHSKQGRVYYRCSRAVNNGAGKRCDAKLIRADQIENAVWSDIVEHIKNPGQIEDAIKQRMAAAGQQMVPATDELDNIEKHIQDKKASRARIISMCARGVINDQEAEAELKELAGDLNTLDKRRQTLFEQQSNYRLLQNQGVEVASMIEQIKDQIEDVDDETKRIVVQLLVDRITIYTFEDPDDGNRRKSRAKVGYRFFSPALYGSNNLRRCSSAMKSFFGTCSVCPRRETSRPGDLPLFTPMK